MTTSDEPPRKKQKISPTKSIRRDYDDKKKQHEDEEEEFFYNLHVNPNIILLSTDPSTPCNTNYDIEYDEDIKPNLFIVKKAKKEYNPTVWLNYHLNECGDIKRAYELLSDSSLSILVVTGAGMGCDSNLPDYRSPGGFWNDYSPMFGKKRLSLYEMSKTDWFQSDPMSAWGFYAHRAKLYQAAVPHSGFYALLSMLKNKNSFYMTSNIDGQAIKAGFDQNKLYQTHGSLHHLQCLKKCQNSKIIPFSNGYDALKLNEKTLRISDFSKIPRCRACGGLTRPNVSFFSDTNETFDDERIQKQKDKFMKWLQPFVDDRKEQLLIIEIGCGKSVHSLRWEAQYLSESNNVTLIRINPSEKMERINTKKPSKNVILKLPAKCALDAINKLNE